MHVNKFGQVPVLVERRDDDDDDSMRFVLTESSAILKYLKAKHFRKRYLHPKCTTAARKMNAMMMMMMMMMPLKEKAKIWSAMDWYQTTIRSSAAGLSWHAFVAQNMGGAVSLELSKHYEGRLKLSLDVLRDEMVGQFVAVFERKTTSIDC